MSSNRLWAVSTIATGAAAQLSGTIATGDEAIIDMVTAHNTSGATVTVTWYLVPPAGAPAAGNQVHRAAIAADATAIIDGLLAATLVAGATVWALASAAGVNTHATGHIRQP